MSDGTVRIDSCNGCEINGCFSIRLSHYMFALLNIWQPVMYI